MSKITQEKWMDQQSHYKAKLRYHSCRYEGIKASRGGNFGGADVVLLWGCVLLILL